MVNLAANIRQMTYKRIVDSKFDEYFLVMILLMFSPTSVVRYAVYSHC